MVEFFKKAYISFKQAGECYLLNKEIFNGNIKTRMHKMINISLQKSFYSIFI